MIATKLFREFFASERAGGLVLIGCTLISLLFSNVGIFPGYPGIWQADFAGHSLLHWINDGLMTFFFLLIGLELEREIYIGELSRIKDTLLPVSAAAGGMIFPAGIYLLFNYGTPAQAGAGIPMATDIAFALGILSLLGNRVPVSLKIFLTALAVIDDLGAILVIAVFYTKTLVWFNLIIALGIFGVLVLLNRLKVKYLMIYLCGGALMWYFMLNSGVHATITGVLLAFAIPFNNGTDRSPSYILQHRLHIPVAFFVLPLFALANTAIEINTSLGDMLSQQYSLGIALGLVCGKPLGIFLASYAAVSAGLCSLPGDLSWKSIAGAGFLGGIGFTMSIFIALLAFNDPDTIDKVKLVILLASLVAAILGYLILKGVHKESVRETVNGDPGDLAKAQTGKP